MFVPPFSACFALLFMVLLSRPADVAAAASGINAFSVVVVKEQMEETLRTAPTGAILQLSPYVVRLSSDWTVVERSTWSGGPTKEGVNKGGLLHCRLPLPQTAEDVALLEQRYVRHNAARTRAAIWRWMEDVSHQDGCVFGEGETEITEVTEWYLFCPRGAIRKVNRTVVIEQAGNSSKELQRKVKRLMQRSRAGASRGVSSSRLLHGWTYIIGAYHEGITQPRWGAERQAWELVYPTNRVCDAWRLDAPTQKTPEAKVPLAKDARKEFWETVVRLYCQPRRKNHRGWGWRVTEVRQACLHEVSLNSPAVCDWARELDTLRVNPIPCISL
ncbi:hypothetical protein DQ04_03101020 [Trypanosoma grayi]|uniref:hypothetical protein n=1 Tax=Trypanosoma grayi TaxID=71804 RepID=UPI0004F47EC1|nr:hypothetical protein DQ04_03101020 [Trypanosoma grayi]KEG10966.1 hypothetical protein DQ04_03101020 [Trypanosoma grayi]